MTDSPFDLEGNYKLGGEAINLNIHEILDLNKWYAAKPSSNDDEIQVQNQELEAGRISSPSPIDYETIRPFFLGVSSDTVRYTLQNMTQYAKTSIVGPNLNKKFKSPFPACNVIR